MLTLNSNPMNEQSAPPIILMSVGEARNRWKTGAIATTNINDGRNKEINKYLLGNKDAAAWINGEFYYTDILLGEVLKEFERQFNVKINVSDIIAARHYSGYFRNDNLAEALGYICTPMNLHYSISKDNSIRIY